MFRASPEYVQYLESFKRFGVREFAEMPAQRKQLGDSISMLVRQDLEFGIIALAPKTYIPYIYSWGKFVGTQVAKQAMATLKVSAATKLASKMFAMAVLKTEVYQDAFARGWTENLAGIPSFTYFDDRAKVFRARDAECDEASGLPNIGKRICFYEGATIAGTTETALGRPVNVFETKCVAAGDPDCEFCAEVDSPFPREFQLLTNDDLKKIRKTIIESMLSKKRPVIRSQLGDYTHLAQFQVLYLGIVLSSPGAHTMLYWVGKNTGTEIANRVRERTMTGQLNAFADFVKHVRIGLLNWERDGNKLSFEVKESAFSTGAANFHKRICSYLAGLIAGFLGTSWNKPVNVVETQCIANGDKVCRFETV
ncbi:MAG: V4R domain-containing protein [Candidatus Aenigmatarchaeota archaeon]|nr:hypothetical protein [Candidatus Aenigmarchaeota archaeon]